jgi:hypothetical protein
MARRKKWDPERMEAAIEAMKKEEMAATKFPEFSTYHKQHYSVMLKTGRKAQVKQ